MEFEATFTDAYEGETLCMQFMWENICTDRDFEETLKHSL